MIRYVVERVGGYGKESVVVNLGMTCYTDAIFGCEPRRLHEGCWLKRIRTKGDTHSQTNEMAYVRKNHRHLRSTNSNYLRQASHDHIYQGKTAWCATENFK